tara:strand:- start:40407 stop:40730 length:324 start_codon:yes stop_codon:yes gene_type:complete
MTSEVKSLQPLAVAPLASVAQQYKDQVKISDHEQPSSSPGASDKDDDEHNANVFEQIIVRNGQEVLVSWTKDEERVVVRKADFRFLPVFMVCNVSRNGAAAVDTNHL